MITVAVIAAGAMGSGVGRRLTEHGASVLTMLEGRSDASRARAEAAGMRGTDAAGLMSADVMLSILPPGEALNLARQLAPALQMSAHKPVYVDCNAIDVATVKAVSEVISETGAAFVDGGIIGGPPKPGSEGPTLYLSGGPAPEIAPLLVSIGIQARAMEGGVGAASALKMSYAGITKGITAIATIMLLGAERAGAGPALRAELGSSQAQLLARFATNLPDMVPKAYRWVAEMREIAAFLGDDAAGATVFEGIAQLYDRIAADAAGKRDEVALIEAFAKGP